jgi:hypothetical protein
MHVLLLWAIPAVVVIGGGTYLLFLKRGDERPPKGCRFAHVLWHCDKKGASGALSNRAAAAAHPTRRFGRASCGRVQANRAGGEGESARMA